MIAAAHACVVQESGGHAIVCEGVEALGRIIRAQQDQPDFGVALQGVMSWHASLVMMGIDRATSLMVLEKILDAMENPSPQVAEAEDRQPYFRMAAAAIQADVVLRAPSLGNCRPEGAIPVARMISRIPRRLS